MMITSVDLTEAEWHSLRELRKGPLKKPIPLSHQLKLINLGLAKSLFASVVATDEGRRYQHRRETKGKTAARSPGLRLVVTQLKNQLFSIDREV